ncbi:MAG TPA: hypothetical protein VER39_15425 [Nocardioidaceae bacterium]|nr:hypothetical protein [Nocardioidaceae bacterium]
MDQYLLSIESRQGFIARADVLSLGLDDRYIRRQLVSRTWTRVRNGAYCSTSLWQTFDDLERHRRLARAVLHAHGDAVALSKVSGLLMRPGCEVWGVDLRRVHVTRRDGRSGSVERDVVHHEGSTSDDEVEVVDGLLVLREPQCVIETIATAGVEGGIVVADSSMHTGRVHQGDLEATFQRIRRRRGSRTVDLVLRLADERSQSVGESRARYVFWRQGLPRPEVQFPVYDRNGLLLGITDLAWPARRLLFEFDGRIKYGRLLEPGQEPGDAVFKEKLREDALRRATGWALERATWSDLSRPVELARRTRERMTWNDTA